jgi:hypothetical protein
MKPQTSTEKSRENTIYFWSCGYWYNFRAWLTVVPMRIWRGTRCRFKTLWKYFEDASDTKPSDKYALIFG